MRGQSVGEGEDGWCEGREGNNDCGQRVQVFWRCAVITMIEENDASS